MTVSVCSIRIVDWAHICVYYTRLTLAKWRKKKKETDSLRHSLPGLNIPFFPALDSVWLRFRPPKRAYRCLHLLFPSSFQNEDTLSVQWPRFFVSNFRYFTTEVTSLLSIKILGGLMPSGGPYSALLTLLGSSWDNCMPKCLNQGDVNSGHPLWVVPYVQILCCSDSHLKHT